MNNRYWMSATDLMDEDTPIRDTDTVDRLNEQDEDITILRSQRAELLAACEALAAFTRDLLKIVTPEQIKEARLTARMLKVSDQGFNALAKARGEK